MEARREPQEEHSMFETTRVLGNFMASSPLLAQAWRQCTVANASTASFVVERIDDVNYVSFSGVQAVLSMANAAGSSGFFSVVPIDSGGNGIFSSLAGDEEDGGEPVLVHAASLHLFFSIYNTPEFQMMLKESQNRAVIFTGHSLGGTIASLATLCFLCWLRSTCSRSTSTMCITFGSPLLGNESLSRAILQERWGGKVCHVVAQSDIVPRLLFCPPDSLSLQLILHLLQSWQFSFRFPQLSNEQKSELYLFISMHIAAAAAEQNLQVSDHQRSSYRPFGSYLLCSTEGAVCIDNPLVIIRMLYLTFIAGSYNLIIEEHLSYEDIVVRIPQLLLRRGGVLQQEVPGSSYGAGISLALEASGIRIQDSRAMEAQECLKMAKKMGLSPNLKCASLAIRLAKVTPCRAQIEWYKVCCDDDLGYYDSFKHRRASKRDSKINMNRIQLAQFWDDLVNMLQNNQLPHDFHKRSKWVNAAQFYMLLVEPLDIAEYYRTQKHKSRGHYSSHGRERRFEVFDRWWRDGKKDYLEGVHHNGDVWKRSKLAGLTQDSCFWARVEEAREWSEIARSEMDRENLVLLSVKLNAFDCYAKQLIERKEVSKDVLAPRSSYSLWVEDWMKLKSELGLQTP